MKRLDFIKALVLLPLFGCKVVRTPRHETSTKEESNRYLSELQNLPDDTFMAMDEWHQLEAKIYRQGFR